MCPHPVLGVLVAPAKEISVAGMEFQSDFDAARVVSVGIAFRTR